MTCNHCGQILPEGTSFCTNCGAPLTQENPAADNTTTTPPEGASVYETPMGISQEGAPAYETPAGNQPYAGMPYSHITPNQVPSIGSYVLWFILANIPVVGLVFDIIWAIDKSYPARANFFRAMLILLAVEVIIGIILGIVFTTILLPMLMAFADELTYFYY